MPQFLRSLTILAFILFSPEIQSQENIMRLSSEQQLVIAGRKSYLRHCMGCHGVDADGKGAAAEMLNPRPRNLKAGAFKFRSTPLGTLPTLRDLVRTIHQGIPNSSMPSFRFLPEGEKLALATYIQSLRPDWKTLAGKAVNLPPPPEGIFEKKSLHLEAALRGQKLYQEACLTCHGEKADGNGPDAAGLTDADNFPLKPANLNLKTTKSGPDVLDIYRAIWTGLDGSPMPAFEGVYSEAQVWDLVAYVLYLRGRAANFYDFPELNESVVARGGKTDSVTETKDASTAAPDSNGGAWR